MRRLFGVATIVATAGVAGSCERSNPVGPSPVTPTDALIAALREQGATVTLGDVLPMAMPCFSVSGRLVLVNAGGTNVFEYASAAAADNDAAKVTSDGAGVIERGCASLITWVGPPHFYKLDQLIVVYAGTADDVLRPLEAVLGKPFASR